MGKMGILGILGSITSLAFIYRTRVFSEGLALLEEAADAVYDWANRASLKLNTAKTKAIVFRLSRT